MSAKSRSPVARNIYRRHLAFVREIRDMYIFIQQSLTHLESAKSTYAASEHKKDRRYFVPAVGRRKFARRKDAELKAIYNRYLNGGLYEIALVSAVSQFESLLTDVLSVIHREYPKGIAHNVQDIQSQNSVPIDVLLNATDIEDAIDEVIRRRLTTVMYGRPEAYIRYLGEVAGVDVTDEVFPQYLEIKATRDLIVHCRSEINSVYLAKAGACARGKIGDAISVDRTYFEYCIAVFTRISGIIERDTNTKFPDEPKGI